MGLLRKCIMMMVNKHMTIASFVDLRFKDKYIAEEEEKISLKERVIDECVCLR